jgi:hypothetical protein
MDAHEITQAIQLAYDADNYAVEKLDTYGVTTRQAISMTYSLDELEAFITALDLLAEQKCNETQDEMATRDLTKTEKDEIRRFDEYFN